MPDQPAPTHQPSPDEAAHAVHGELHHPGDLAGEAHGADDHGETHGHDDHAHGEEALGPVDVAAWTAFVVGIGAGLLIVLCLVLTIAVIGTDRAAPARLEPARAAAQNSPTMFPSASMSMFSPPGRDGSPASSASRRRAG